MTDVYDPPRTKGDDVAGMATVLSGVVAAVTGFLFGGLTDLGQTYLPEWLHSLANSGSPWVLLAVGLALLTRTPRSAAVAGFLALAGLEIGYVAMADARHFPSAPTTVTFWLLAAAVFGPLAGLVAHSLQARTAPWNAVGGGLLAGIVSGEGLAAYLSVRDTTSPGYWVAQTAVGMVIVVIVGRRSVFGWALAAFAVGIAALLATRLVLVF
jgi:Family of unknown function (DUF6518)